MSKFETNVAGVTFYDVDFSRIKTSSKVELIPEPENKYDSNAIKVIIDGKQVGHIKRTVNTTIIDLWNRGAQVRARVNAVVGGENGKNQGIVLAISIYEQREQPQADDLGKWSKEKPEDFIVARTHNPVKALSEYIPTWESFLENCEGLPSVQPIPTEPDYELQYKNSTSFFHRLLSNDYDDFIETLKREWKIDCDKAKQANVDRNRLIKGYSKTDYAQEFDEFVLKERIKRAFKDNAITCQSDSEIRKIYEKGYLSSYENLLFENLAKIYPSYQQAKYKGYMIDILLVAPKTNMLWAIEVEGSIHRRKKIAERDADKVAHLTATGVSVIRVTNFYIGHHLEKAVARITETIG